MGSVILFAGLVIWLATAGRLQGIVNALLDGFWNFYANIADSQKVN